MPQDVVLPAANLLSLISVAVTPIGLISTSAILLGSFTAKHNNLSVQLRSLTNEHRQTSTSEERRSSLERQARLFLRRITAIWAACACLYMALLFFVGMVISIVLASHLPRLSDMGFLDLMLGLVLIGAAVALELYEIYLARITLCYEVEDLRKR